MEDPKHIFNYDIELNTEKIFQVYLLRKGFNDKLEFDYVDTKDYYYLDILKSYAVEFSLGGFYPYSDKDLHSSRFYYIFEYLHNGHLIKKDLEFNNWADDIIKSFRKVFLEKLDNYPKKFFTKRCMEWIGTNKPLLAGGGGKFVIQ